MANFCHFDHTSLEVRKGHLPPSLFTQDALLFKESVAHLSGGGRFFNATFQVAACTVVGCGPWSPPVLVMPASGTSTAPSDAPHSQNI